MNVEEIIIKARENMMDKAVKGYVKQVEDLIKLRMNAVKVVFNLDREIEELKLKIETELKDINPDPVPVDPPVWEE